MLKEEWLQIGYEKGLIDDVSENEWVLFESVYRAWFQMKINRIRPQSVDRLEVTYNKYYRCSELAKMPVHAINENVIYNFLNSLLIERGNITEKEYKRIYQIVNNVMQYGFDLNMGHCYCVNWDIVKRYIALENVKRVEYKEMCVSYEDRRIFAQAVFDGVYIRKQSASLCLLLNFYLGLRIGELAGLTWDCVDFASKCIYVCGTEVKSFKRDDFGERVGAVRYNKQDRTKTEHGMRCIPLVNESVYILELLREWHDIRGYNSEFLAYDGAQTALSRSLEHALRKLCEYTDIPYFSSHRIRKTFATVLHNNGVPTKVISDLMGHAEMRTTERNYIVSSPDSLNMVRDVMRNVPIIDLSERGC